MLVDAVIFDMDGVLVDSEPTWVACERQVFAQYGVHLTTEDCRQTRGLRVDAVARYWFARRPWVGATPEQVGKQVADAVTASLSAHAHALPGARQAPHQVRALGLRCAIASSSAQTIIDTVVDALDLRDALQSLHTADDHARGKPHPAVYLAAAASLNVPPERCLAIEDSVTGLISARGAGMITLAIPDPDRREDPRFSIAHHRLDSLLELPDLLARLRRDP